MRLYELTFAAACLPAVFALVWVVAVTAAMWLIRVLLRIPGIRQCLSRVANRVLPEPRPRQARMTDTIPTDGDDAEGEQL